MFSNHIVYVPPEINKTDRLIIAQDPGKEEMREGRPLIGPSGQETMKALEQFGVSRSDVSLSNSCDCVWMSEEKSEEIQLEVINTLQTDLGIDKLATKPKKSLFEQLLREQCKKKIAWEIENYNPKVILLMGKAAMQMFDECPYNSIMQAIGGNFKLNTGQTVYLTNHPASILHAKSQESKEAIRKEFMRGVECFVKHEDQKNESPLYIRTINTYEDLLEFTNLIVEQPMFAIDWETTGVDFLSDKITDLSVAWNENEAVVIDLSIITNTGSQTANEAITSKLDEPEWKEAINTILSCSAEKACHNGYFELLFAWKYGLKITNFVYDTMNMYSNLCEAQTYPKDLNALLQKYCNMTNYDGEVNAYRNSVKKVTLAELENAPFDYTFFGDTIIPKSVLFEYAGKDAIATFRAVEPLKREMKKDGCWNCYWEERFLPYPTAKMTFNGMEVDLTRGVEMMEITEKISDEARNSMAQAYLEFVDTLPQEKRDQYDPIIQKVNLIERCNLQLSGCVNAINPKSFILLDALFNNLGIYCPNEMKTETGKQSWSEPVITHLLESFTQDEFPIQHKALLAKAQYEKINTQSSRYLFNKTGEKGMLSKINSTTNRIHSLFRAYGTETGRPTSKEPNLYNITNTEKLKDLFPNNYKQIDIRSLFPAPPNHKIVSMDYKQAELRILAMDANHSQKQICDNKKIINGLIKYIARKNLEERGDRYYKPTAKSINMECERIWEEVYKAVQEEWAAPMLKFFIEGLPYPNMDFGRADPERYVVVEGIPYWTDIHSWVASLFMEKEPWEIDKNNRRKAKTVIFGLNYGMSDETLASRLGTTTQEAHNLVVKIYSKLGNIQIYQRFIEYTAISTGKIQNIFGQIRHFGSELTHHNLREAIDYRPQSTTSKLMNRSVIQIYDLIENMIPESGVQMILTVYDDFKFYCPNENIDLVVPLVKEIMEQPIPGYNLGLPVDVVIGDRWSEVEEEKEETS